MSSLLPEWVSLVGEVDEIVYSNHGDEMVNGGRAEVPDFVVEQAVKQLKGHQWYDTDKDSVLFVYQKNVFVCDIEQTDEGVKAVLITFYRNQKHYQFRNQDRYVKI